jgi:hypothetical protein
MIRTPSSTRKTVQSAESDAMHQGNVELVVARARFEAKEREIMRALAGPERARLRGIGVAKTVIDQARLKAKEQEVLHASDAANLVEIYAPEQSGRLSSQKK